MYKFHYEDGEVHTVSETTMMFAYYNSIVHRRERGMTIELEKIMYNGMEFGLVGGAEFVNLN